LGVKIPIFVRSVERYQTNYLENLKSKLEKYNPLQQALVSQSVSLILKIINFTNLKARK